MASLPGEGERQSAIGFTDAGPIRRRYLPPPAAPKHVRNERAMSQVAKLFTCGRSQAVRLPAACRFDTKEVFIHKDHETGNVILSRKPATWDDFFLALEGADVPVDFLGEPERTQATKERDPFKDWRE